MRIYVRVSIDMRYCAHLHTLSTGVRQTGTAGRRRRTQPAQVSQRRWPHGTRAHSRVVPKHTDNRPLSAASTAPVDGAGAGGMLNSDEPPPVVPQRGGWRRVAAIILYEGRLGAAHRRRARRARVGRRAPASGPWHAAAARWRRRAPAPRRPVPRGRREPAQRQRRGRRGRRDRRAARRSIHGGLDRGWRFYSGWRLTTAAGALTTAGTGRAGAGGSSTTTGAAFLPLRLRRAAGAGAGASAGACSGAWRASRSRFASPSESLSGSSSAATAGAATTTGAAAAFFFLRFCFSSTRRGLGLLVVQQAQKLGLGARRVLGALRVDDHLHGSAPRRDALADVPGLVPRAADLLEDTDGQARLQRRAQHPIKGHVAGRDLA